MSAFVEPARLQAALQVIGSTAAQRIEADAGFHDVPGEWLETGKVIAFAEG